MDEDNDDQKNDETHSLDNCLPVNEGVPRNDQPEKQRKTNAKKNYYIADLAAVSDEEPESTGRGVESKTMRYQDMDYIDTLTQEAETYNKELQEHIRRTRIREQRRKDKLEGSSSDFGLPLDELEGKYVQPSFRQSSVNIKYSHDGVVVDEAQDLRTERLLPSIADPKLWKVSCNPGKERQSVIELLTTFQWRKGTAKELHIMSAFTSDLCRGYIYIEAHTREQVVEAVSLVTTLYSWKMVAVPLIEMPETLEPAKQMFDIKTGSWVKVTRGVYKGDIASVSNVLDDGFKLEIKIVPRIDFRKIKHVLSKRVGKSQPADQGKSEDKSVRGGKSAAKKLENLQARSKAPPARLFDESEIKRHLDQFYEGEEIEGLFKHVRGATFFMNQKFVDGLRVLKASAHSLELNIVPTERQLKKFHSSETFLEGARPFDGVAREIAVRGSFRLDDNVRVVSGDLASLTGKIISIKADRIFVEPHHKDLNDPLEFSACELEKYFIVGAHVKVIRGNHKNETGFVTNVDEEEKQLSVFSDVGNKILTVAIMDAIETSEISIGKIQLGSYTLLDFVQIDDDNCGIIVQVMQKSLKLLNDRGIVQTVELKDIKRKRFNRNVFALDKNSHQITIGDVVKVVGVQNAYSDQMGTVRNIYKNGIFLYSKDIKENCGIFVAQSSELLVTGARKQTRAKRADSHTGKGAALDSRRHGKRVGVEGKYVTITKGIFKGQRGIIKSMPNLEKYVVELLGENKIVTVDKEDAEESHDGSLAPPPDSGGITGTPVLGVRTPAVRYANTPRMTPSYGTPSLHGGKKTPLYGSKTPLYGSKTPRYGSKTPLYGSKTPRYGSKTPLYSESHDMTPRYDPRETPQYDKGFRHQGKPSQEDGAGEEGRGDGNGGGEGRAGRGRGSTTRRGRGNSGFVYGRDGRKSRKDEENYRVGGEMEFTPSYGAYKTATPVWGSKTPQWQEGGASRGKSFGSKRKGTPTEQGEKKQRDGNQQMAEENNDPFFGY